MSSQPVRIGILGASSIAQTSIIAPAKLLSDKVVIAAIAARDLSRAKVYAETHGIPRVFASYEELIADRDIDAVYISLPIAYHAKYAVLAIEHGKHVMSETPSSANEDETRQILAALSKKNAEDASKKVQYFVGYHWRSHPVQRRVRELLKYGRIGTLQHVELKMILPAAWFPVRTGSIFFQYATGGGAGIDLGSYPVNTVLFSLGDPVNARFKVIDAKPSFDPELDEPQLDTEMDFSFEIEHDGNMVTAHAIVNYEGTSSDTSDSNNSVVLQGTSGTITVNGYYWPHDGHTIAIDDMVTGATTNETQYGSEEKPSAYFYQLQEFANAVTTGESGEWLHSAEQALLNVRIVDAVYEKAGLQRRFGMLN